MVRHTDNGHPERAFFQKFETFGLGQTNWAEILWGIWGISGQTISTILALWVPCPLERVAGSLSYKKLWFSGLNHITLKYSQNKKWDVKNSGNSVILPSSVVWHIDILSWKLTSETFHTETIATLHSLEVSHKFIKGYQIFKEQPNFFKHQKRERIFFTLIVFSTKYANSKSFAFQYEF